MGLKEFRRTLMAATQYSKFQEKARVSFADISTTSAIVSRYRNISGDASLH